MSAHQEDFEPSMAIRAMIWPEPNDQRQSPLYSRLPAEIRMLIFELAFTPLTTSMPPHDLDVRYDHEPDEDAPSPRMRHASKIDPAVKYAAALEALVHGDDELIGESFRELNVLTATGNHDATNEGDDYVPGTAERFMTVWDNESLGAWVQPVYTYTGFEWLRPEFRGAKRTDYSLLRTCRRIYLEAADLPALTKELVFYFASLDTPPGTIGYNTEVFFQQIPYRAAASIRSLHFYGDQGYFEDYVSYIGRRSKPTAIPRRLAKQYPLEGYLSSDAAITLPHDLTPVLVVNHIQRLRFTIRGTDWLQTRHGYDPCFHVYGRKPSPHSDAHGASWPDLKCSLCERDQVPAGHPHKWEEVFSRMPSLQRLVVDFEAVESQYEAVQRIVDWAQTWRFQLGPSLGCRSSSSSRGVLTTDIAAGGGLRKMSWRGLPHQWPHMCTRCGMVAREGQEYPRKCEACDDLVAEEGWENVCKECKRRDALLREGKGPRMYVWTLEWAVERDHDTRRPSHDVGTTDSELTNGESAGEGEGQAADLGPLPWFDARSMARTNLTYGGAVELDRAQRKLGACLPYWSRSGQPLFND